VRGEGRVLAARLVSLGGPSSRTKQHERICSHNSALLSTRREEGMTSLHVATEALHGSARKPAREKLDPPASCEADLAVENVHLLRLEIPT